mmetsp:Transcript_44746/g.103346  ORF Transcript_44746/g.103346 Transcript_44746/m.103346 type:complete len:201 (-) Transcript_44746:1743-2345(-)
MAHAHKHAHTRTHTHAHAHARTHAHNTYTRAHAHARTHTRARAHARTILLSDSWRLRSSTPPSCPRPASHPRVGTQGSCRSARCFPRAWAFSDFPVWPSAVRIPALLAPYFERPVTVPVAGLPRRWRGSWSRGRCSRSAGRWARPSPSVPTCFPTSPARTPRPCGVVACTLGSHREGASWRGSRRALGGGCRVRSSSASG